MLNLGVVPEGADAEVGILADLADVLALLVPGLVLLRRCVPGGDGTARPGLGAPGQEVFSVLGPCLGCILFCVDAVDKILLLVLFEGELVVVEEVAGDGNPVARDGCAA